MPQTGNAGEKRVLAVLVLLLGVGLVPWLAEARDGGGRSQNLRGATTGPTSAPGYDHPNQYLFRTAETIAPKALEETGQLDNTVIIFTSDNGAEEEIPPHSRSPFRGGKGSSWEGGVRVPTFVYWKGMIAPRRSDGLFDQADLFNTILSLAGVPGADVTKHLPKDRYTDGIDQTSFWLADNGQSSRRSRFYTMNEFLSAVRIDEFKLHVAMQVQDSIVQRGFPGGFSGGIFTQTGGVIAFNLYTNRGRT